ENTEYLKHIASIAQVNVTYGSKLATSAWYLAAWAADALGRAGASPKIAVKPAGRTLGIELSGPDFRVALECEGGTLAVTVNDMVERTNLGGASDYLLMREELAIMRRDQTFERALSAALQLAQSS